MTKKDLAPIDAEPTKSFFVDMLTRDIPLEQAVLDLVDNSVDGAKSLATQGQRPFEGRTVKIEFDSTRFRILDNCGGFDTEAAIKYAFKFGRSSSIGRTPHSIGQFGVGMKRALFKFGDHFLVRAATTKEEWSVDVDVKKWEAAQGWHFPWGEFTPDENISVQTPGVEIVVTKLRQEVSTRFSTKNFETQIIALVKSKHRQFIAQGMSISVNGVHVTATDLYLLVTEDRRFQPGIDSYVISNEGKSDVKVKIVVGLGDSAPRAAGWYVVCNGRVVLEADRRQETGWGLIEESSNNVVIPSFHNQFARFRGIVNLDSDDSARVPWNTTKTDIDKDNPVWQDVFPRMQEMMRPVISFLNELDNDIDEHTRDSSPLLDVVKKAKTVKADELVAKAQFTAPSRASVSARVKTTKIQYSRPVDQISFLMTELGVNTATAVGAETFDLIYRRMGGK
ncbi:ATP-binding protein [Variovorax sp. 22077]|uniref:ATP-binding protein n=1 Tax=Variovorax sp. 22077 TaxID=3453867 RepID=UPI003F847611